MNTFHCLIPFLLETTVVCSLLHSLIHDDEMFHHGGFSGLTVSCYLTFDFILLSVYWFLLSFLTPPLYKDKLFLTLTPSCFESLDQ